MVHKAMRELLGETATQAGSENAPGRFRFDFPNAGPVPTGVLSDVEQKVNEVLINDLAVTAQLMPLAEARDTGAMALFGEKYGETVRVVSVGDWTRELCGGTHAHHTGQLGLIKLLGESSIGAGVRRIEALVGMDAYSYLAREHTLVHLLSEQLKVPADQLPDRVGHIVQRLRDAEKEIERERKSKLAAELADVTAEAHRVGDVDYYGVRAPDGLDPAGLRDLALTTRKRAGQDLPAVVLALSASDGKVAAVAAVNDTAQKAGIAANAVLAAALAQIDGRGGGKADVAQGGGSKPEGIDAALTAGREAVAAR